MAASTGGRIPAIGEDGVISEGRTFCINSLPVEIGIRRQPVEYTHIDASQQFLAVGSAQGYVWVIDLLASRLSREFNECRGSAITAIKLNPVRDYVAYGTDNGVLRVERISKAMPHKLRVQEKSGQCVSCMEWNESGEDIFCGFSSGRLVQFNVRFKEGAMKHIQLNPENYGSAVVQLSASGSLLLVSTLDRAFLLDINTNKLVQVGRKERKSGRYGGCFVESGKTMLLARPGFRIWIADKSGKVLNTMAFKEALSSQHLPAVGIHSQPTSVDNFSRSWQFSSFYPLLDGKFVVTFQENSLYVLDPINGVVVGVAGLKDSIKSISTSGGFLYILPEAASKAAAIIRVAVHYSYVTTENEPRKLIPSTPSTSMNNSPTGSLENLATNAEVKCDPHQRTSPPKEVEIEAETKKVETSTTEPIVTMPTIHVSEYEMSQASGENGNCKENESDVSKGPVVHSISDEDGGSKESTVKNELSNSFPEIASDFDEHSRHLLMSQAAGDDIVANNKSHRRKKKKNKGKKLSSAASSTSVSMEKLEDITEEQDNDVSVKGSSVKKIADPQEIADLLDDLKIDDSSVAVTSTQKIADPQEIADLLDDLKIDDPSVAVTSTQDGFQQLEDFFEDQSGVQCTQDEKLNEHEQQNKAPESVVIEELFKNDSTSVEEEKCVLVSSSASVEEEKRVLASSNGDGQNEMNSLSKTIDTSTPGLESDNPLYQDTDEELIGGGQTSCIEDTVQYQHSVLQPALSDPLQDEETLETGTSSNRQRLVPELFRRAEQPATKMQHRQVTSWIDIGEADTFYTRDQHFDCSDSSHDSEPESFTGADVTTSQVADDFYQLCGDLVKNKADPQSTSIDASNNQFSVSNSNYLSHTPRLCEAQEGANISCDDRASEEQSMDIWVSVPFPSRHSLQCVSLSDVLLWAVDSRGRVFCSPTSNRGRNWQLIKKSMQQVSSSPSGRVVWSTYHQNAYARLGIGMNPAGSSWKNITKNTSLAHKIRQLAVEESGIWAITTDNRVIFRKGVDERNPEGRVWQEVTYGMDVSFISCCKNIVWALSNAGKVYVRDGITPSSPSGKKWMEIKSPSMIAVSITNDGVIWGVNSDGSVGFRTGLNPSKPGGRGPWWEVAINSDLQALSPLNSLWQVMSVDGSHRLSSAVSSLVHLPHQNPVTTVCASSKAGVVVLEAGHRLHGCWKAATGYHYTPACREGTFQFNAWSRVAAGGTSLWFVRNDGDLYCLSPGSKLKRVEVPASVELIAASPNCMWVISKDMVWSRQGMTSDFPEGISFDYIELSTLLHNKKLRSVACGKKVSWAIDSSGVPHFRFGVHAREPGTGMSPAWVPVEDHPGPLLQIAVSPDGWLVWACDEEHSVYVRTGVTVDFPVGRKWTRIPKQKIKELAATTSRIYGISPSGELVCRYGVCESNVQGSFWRKLPGKYEHITTGAFGELWTLDNKGQVWKQEWKVLDVSALDFESNLTDPESWEFL